MKKRIAIIALLFSVQLFSQAIYEDERYIPETDPLVLAKIEQWQDQKFGLLMHWGTYSQWGIVESWSICPEDYGWCERKKGSNPSNYNDYVKEYEDLRKTFNPVKFNPEKWAKAAKNAGIKYMVFTTKHHDGFNMFDTKYSNYKVTNKEVPFSTNPKANIAKEVFDAFRKENMWIGAYFSKPDWHNENYWDPYFPPFDRNVNYDPAAYPEKWKKYTDFTHNQILELLSDYGKIDILWLDGGWVQKLAKEEIKKGYEAKFAENESGNGFIKHRVVDQDIKMDELVDKAREKQPGLIVVDRAVHSKNQNYLTPENRVPEKTLPYPWESCITSGGGWSYTPDAKYLTGRQGIHMLIDIVAKGGNLLLNVAPGPDGEWQQGAYDLLAEYGAWLKVNGSGIYNTKPIAPFKENNICMTQNKAGNVFLFYMAKEGENKIPAEVIVKSISPKKGTAITMLGSKTKLKWEKVTEGFKVTIPENLRNNLPSKEAWTLKIEKINR
ncbi:alpha-L-fucosidase [Flavobacterium flevense]|uniref:alpha-L-fucosidase n=1 Tax=Flavobacterium flevense TaxID=983 RepID=A0A4Y4B259_9FLAO|nr:alpha-L-fucosidase [Flavobacterium flevense]GEC72994.1 alpha-L-fucosidase [Flavobacterium flevense]SHM12735.1 alpha-L-fucosidase [Flavobacterium flevense]